jgi:hypothetical protein
MNLGEMALQALLAVTSALCILYLIADVLLYFYVMTAKSSQIDPRVVGMGPAAFFRRMTFVHGEGGRAVTSRFARACVFLLRTTAFPSLMGVMSIFALSLLGRF